MVIQDLKELEKLIKLCRKTGIDTISIDGITFSLGAQPQSLGAKTKLGQSLLRGLKEANEYQITEDTKILTSELTPEQLMFYSSQGHEPQDNQ